MKPISEFNQLTESELIEKRRYAWLLLFLQQPEMIDEAVKKISNPTLTVLVSNLKKNPSALRGFTVDQITQLECHLLGDLSEQIEKSEQQIDDLSRQNF